jgi:hypothetical protein
MSGNWLADRSGLRNADRVAGREDDIAFGLPVKFVDDEAKCRFAPLICFRAKRFTA